VYLKFKAPFAAFRPFQTGSYRSTTPIPSPSTVYGILLNLAGIEQRAELSVPVTSIRKDLPKISIAIAKISQEKKAFISQQLHQYPVGASGKELAQKTHGAKYWISPVRREVIVDLVFLVGVQAEPWLLDRIVKGLNGELGEERYGFPFAGDNNFLFDSVELFESPPMARWYYPLQEGERPNRGACRLTIWIDRQDNSKTQTEVFVPSDFVLQPPELAWIELPPQTT
jgi:CRISPR-associated protein Cas5t